MQIDGWHVSYDPIENNILRVSRERTKTHYLITLVKDYAIDIEILKEDIDKIPENERKEFIIKIIRNAIQQAGEKGPFYEGEMQWNCY